MTGKARDEHWPILRSILCGCDKPKPKGDEVRKTAFDHAIQNLKSEDARTRTMAAVDLLRLPPTDAQQAVTALREAVKVEKDPNAKAAMKQAIAGLGGGRR